MQSGSWPGPDSRRVRLRGRCRPTGTGEGARTLAGQFFELPSSYNRRRKSTSGWDNGTTYFDENTVAQAIDTANVDQQNGARKPVDLQLGMITDADLAQKVTERELVAVSTPTAVMTLEDVQREAYALRPGDVAILDWPPDDIKGMVIRIGNVQGGTLQDGALNLDAGEDIFSFDEAAIETPDGSDWVDPAADLNNVETAALIEAPYEFLKTLFPTESQAYALTFAARPRGFTLGYNILAKHGGVYIDSPEIADTYCPHGALAAALTKTSSSITVGDAVDVDRVKSLGAEEFDAGYNLAWIRKWTDVGFIEELVAFRTITDNEDGTYTLSDLACGCVDTTPAEHEEGADVWFLSAAGREPLPLPVDETPEGGGPPALLTTPFKFQSFAIELKYPMADCLEVQIYGHPNLRQVQPYICADFRVNSDPGYPATFSFPVTLSWKHRNRLTPWGYADSGALDAAEPGVDYRILIYGTEWWVQNYTCTECWMRPFMA